jgi:hypothetical protein
MRNLLLTLSLMFMGALLIASPADAARACWKAENIWLEYRSDPDRAEDRFERDNVCVKGVVARKSEELARRPFVQLEAGEFGPRVQCVFDSSVKRPLSRVREGSQVRLYCEGRGKWAGYILFRDCRFKRKK